MKCCLQDTTWPPQSCSHCTYIHPHKIKATRSVNFLTGLTKWTLWVISKKEEMKGVVLDVLNVGM